MRRYKILFFLIITLLAFMCGLLGVRREFRRHGANAEPVTILIAKNTPTLAIGQQMRQAGVIHSAYLFDAVTHLYPGKPLKAGEYFFPAHATLTGVIMQMRAGLVIVHRLTIPEGLTNLQIKALIEGEPALSGAIGTLPSEGTLMPSTYSFTRGDERAALAKRMHDAAVKLLADEWAAREASLPLQTPEQALVLASIVEKETGVAAERPKIAAVFYNRLAKSIPLQSDPTIIYAMSKGLGVIDRPLGHHDLAFDSPYNTYEHVGLPPAPICNPGRASLDAVLHPDHDDYFYFVATGIGGHAFAQTIEQHNANVANYLKALREKQH